MLSNLITTLSKPKKMTLEIYKRHGIITFFFPLMFLKRETKAKSFDRFDILECNFFLHIFTYN